MLRFLNQVLFKCIIAVVIVFAVILFRDFVLTDENTVLALHSLMGTLPFSESTADIVSDILKIDCEIPITGTASKFVDFLRLAIMACIQPLVVKLLTAVLVPVSKDGTSVKRYKHGHMKELLITIISAPLLAVAASWFTSLGFSYLSDAFGDVVSALLGVLSVIILNVVTNIPLLLGGIAVGTVILWRFLISFGFRMLTTLVTNTLCLAGYMAILDGAGHQIATTIATLIIWLIVAALGLKLLQFILPGRA